MKLTMMQIRGVAAKNPEMGAFLKALGEMTYASADHRDDPILKAAWNAERTHVKMVEANNWLARKAEEVSRRLAYKVTAPTNEISGLSLYTGLNSCGELQGNASSYEIAVARFSDASDIVKALINERAHDERRVENAEELARLNECASLVSAFEVGGNGATLLQLAKRLAQDPTAVGTRLATLIEHGFVKEYGVGRKTYSFNANKEGL